MTINVGFAVSQRLFDEIPYNILPRRMLVRVLCGGIFDCGDDITMVDIDKMTDVSSNKLVSGRILSEIYIIFEHCFQLGGI